MLVRSAVGVLLVVAVVVASASALPRKRHQSPLSGIPSTTGVKLTLTEAGLEYGKDVGVKILLSQLSTISVPDVHGSTGTPIGDIDYDLTGISLHGLTIGAASVSIASGTGLQVSCTGVGISGHLNWHYRESSWPHISDGGDADIGVSGASISIVVQVGVDGSGRPSIKTQSCSVDLGNLSIDLHGGASWLYQLFVSLFSGQIKSGAQGAVHDAIVQAVDQQAEQALASVPIVVTLDNYAEINYEFTAAPQFTSNYLTTEHLGEFYQRSGPTEAPYTAGPMPDVVDAQMLQVFVSDFVANSAGFVYQRAGQLQISVMPDDLPSWSPVQLNTTSWRYLVPALYAKYPNAAMRLVISADTPPVAQFAAASGLTVHGTGTVDVQVLLADNKTYADAFALELGPLLSGTITVKGTNIVGDLELLNTTIAVNRTSIGPIAVAPLQSIVNVMLKNGIVPILNIYAQRGLPLPVMDGVQLVSPTVSFGQGYVAVASDITYTPTLAATRGARRVFRARVAAVDGFWRGRA